jgi:hypothetical protein
MSNALAIAAATATLRNLIANNVQDLPNQNVTTRPLDKARNGNSSPDQLNIFLYQTVLNAAWRNTDMPRQLRPGETGQPPLALNLHYLVTAYGQNDDETQSHRWLGKAMSVLHDHPVLGAQEIQDALKESGLQAQIERVRITSQPMSLDDMSKLWTTFQTQYRISAAYQVEVVLIESTRPARTPLPVLRRGEDDRGVTAVAGVSLPTIEEVRLPNGQSSLSLGDELIINGQNLNDLAAVRFTVINPRWADFKPISILPLAVQATDRGIKVTLPNDAAAHTAWVAGFYTVAVVVNRNKQTWSSNELPISLAPRIEKIDPGNVVARGVDGKVTLTLTCNPEVRLAAVSAQQTRFDQQVVLLLGTARQVSPEPPPPPPPLPAPVPASTNKLTLVFPIGATELGEYLIRLRVDGVDLALVDRTVTPPQFDAKQKVTIT